MIIDRIRGFVRGWPYNRRTELNTKKFHTDFNNDKSLKGVLTLAPEKICPNPDCPNRPIIGSDYIGPEVQLVYMESIKAYYCPRCERTYSYDPNSIGFDDDGIDVSRATDNPVNDSLKSNTIIRSFGDIKDNKGNNSKYEREQKTIKQIADKELKGNYKEYRNTDGLI